MTAPATTEEITYTDFVRALETAIDKGWVSKIVCATHDGVPHNEEEHEEFEEGFDPCAPIVRLWDPVT